MSGLGKVKIVCDGWWLVNQQGREPHVHVYDADGKDVTTTMNITRITIHIVPGELVRATLEIFAPSLQIDATDEGLEKSLAELQYEPGAS